MSNDAIHPNVVNHLLNALRKSAPKKPEEATPPTREALQRELDTQAERKTARRIEWS